MDEAVVKRIKPHSPEAEQSVIAVMLMDSDVIAAVSETVSADDFYDSRYGAVYAAITELYNEGRPADLVTVQERLRAKSVPPEVSELDFIQGLYEAMPTSANAVEYARIVHDKAVLRRLIKAGEQTQEECYAGEGTVEDILDSTEKRLFDIIKERGSSEITPIKDIALEAIERIEQAAKNKSDITGIPTGFQDLDHKLSGLQKQDLVLVAARPSMGKTAFALNIAQHVSIKEKKKVALFSLEMSKEQLMNRLMSMESRVDSQLIRTGRLSSSDWSELIAGASRIVNSQMIIDDTPAITVPELRSKCRRFKLEYGLDLVIIDYLQLMTASRKGNDNRQQEISEISRSLKAVAREIDAPVIAISQLSRAPEARNDKRPMLSDLRESGAIEQDADVVMLLYRDSYYNKDSENPNLAEVNIAKQRNGPTGTVELMWLAEYTKFVSVQH